MFLFGGFGGQPFPHSFRLLVESISLSVHLLSCVRFFVTPWTISQSLLKLIKSVMPSNHLILCHLLLLHSIFPSITVFSKKSVLCIRSPKYRSFSFSISPSSEYSGLISFKIDWFDLLAVQGTLEFSLTPQFKIISSSVLSFLYGSTLISIHDYWENHSFD